VQCLFSDQRPDALNMDNSKCYAVRPNSADWHFECKRVGGLCALLNSDDASLIFVTASIILHHIL